MKEEPIDIQRTSKSKEKGITLVALVITIVILIILATVTISVIFGEGGLIERAQQAKDITDGATQKEQEELSKLETYLNDLPSESIIVEVPKEWDISKVTPELSDDNIYVPVPKGFTASTIPEERKVEDGFVIKEGNNGNATSGVNEFVWIPVGDYTTMYQEAPGTKLTGVETTTDVYSKLRIRGGDSFIAGTPNSTNVREPDLLSQYDTDEKYYKEILGYNNPTEMAEAFVEEYKATYDSIKKYHGFYIGRYELTGTVDTPTVQRNQDVLTNQNWYNLKKACSNVISSKYAQSTMVYGNQWDEIMSWLIVTGDKTDYQINENSADWGNYSDSIGAAATNSGSKQTSGKNEAWKANNIYDLAGNWSEWTEEASGTSFRADRAGNCYFSASTYPATARNYGKPNISINSNIGYSSRPALYIK